jgi:C-terminal processing protease CtpA/Prc
MAGVGRHHRGAGDDAARGDGAQFRVAPADRGAQQLAAVFGMVKSDYVEPVDEKKLITDAIGGMVAGLDPHSQYFDKKTFKEFREGDDRRFVGVGIEIGMEDGLVKVVRRSKARPRSAPA